MIFIIVAVLEVGVLLVANYESSLRRSDRNVVADGQTVETGSVTSTLNGGGNHIPETDTEASTSVEVDPPRNQVRTNTSVETVFELPDDVEIWHRDNAYMVKQLEFSTGSTKSRENSVPSPEDDEADAFKVLVVGDSFVWGWGFYDTDRVWHQVLSSKLSEKFGPGAYRIESVGHQGTSMISYSEYLSAEEIKKHDPDLIVLGFLPNDWQADGSEKRICRGKSGTGNSAENACELGAWYTRPEYVKCLEGRSNIIGATLRRVVKPFFPRAANSLIERLCDPKSYPDDVYSPNELREMGKDPENSPYWQMYLDSIRAIRSNAGNVPVVALPTSTNEYIVNPVVYEALNAGGIKVVQTPVTKAVLTGDGSREQKGLWINPADPHPNPELHYAYGTDIFTYISGKYPKKGTRSGYQMSLFSNFSPSSMKFVPALDGTAVSFGHDPGSWAALRQTVRNDYRTVPTPPQVVPCAPYGRPHARFVFNPDVLTSAFTATITLDGRSDETLVYSTVSYGSNGQETFSRPVPFKPGESFNVTFDTRTTSFVVGSASSGCPVNKPINLPAFDLSVTVR
jgi:hypothetical protein